MEVNHLIIFIAIWFCIIGTALVYLSVVHGLIEMITRAVENCKDVNSGEARYHE